MIQIPNDIYTELLQDIEFNFNLWVEGYDDWEDVSFGKLVRRTERGSDKIELRFSSFFGYRYNFKIANINPYTVLYSLNRVQGRSLLQSYFYLKETKSKLNTQNCRISFKELIQNEDE